jgi:Ca2+-binding EF-hand superfamily protein
MGLHRRDVPDEVVRAAFNKYDIDHDGTISRVELVCECAGRRQASHCHRPQGMMLADLGFKDIDRTVLHAIADVNGDGKVRRAKRRLAGVRCVKSARPRR